MDFEIRSGDGLRALSRGKVGGYAARFNSPSCDLGGFTEIIRPGAFASSLRAGLNIRALYHHDDLSLLGTTQAGTLRLREDDSGLAFELDLPDTSYGRDVAVLVERGDIAGCSFGFRVEANGDFWEERAGAVVRELRAVHLHEITLTHDPAYRDTTVAKRSMPGTRPRDLRALWLETL
ncbi:HK97 family phage prohead protease [Burkholderia ubonensis]|uniref:Histone H1 n=1 Tax=Burkholderia ubonensis TaxID=101571 RepID=A0A107GBS4_9BURK|nr:HK97 family phage prohead protease [Burkholderia ubonensis]KWD74344.1 histone H1 [Burkholderia ubonensis]KWD90639.1 histone H1 [Burkholderia ubonensis]KWE02480.1 histone H1 [Burkholderia ubonensis]KWE08945.1 histone H1 [Burkholderia ubonensis]